MKCQRGGRGKAVLCNLVLYGVGGQCHPSATLPLETNPVHMVQEAGWVQDQSGEVLKILPPLGFGSQTLQPVGSCYTIVKYILSYIIILLFVCFVGVLLWGVEVRG